MSRRGKRCGSNVLCRVSSRRKRRKLRRTNPIRRLLQTTLMAAWAASANAAMPDSDRSELTNSVSLFTSVTLHNLSDLESLTLLEGGDSTPTPPPPVITATILKHRPSAPPILAARPDRRSTDLDASDPVNVAVSPASWPTASVASIDTATVGASRSPVMKSTSARYS